MPGFRETVGFGLHQLCVFAQGYRRLAITFTLLSASGRMHRTGRCTLRPERRLRRSNLEERAWSTMKVLLLKDVYKLGRAGEVKKVAAGYGRNYLIPQGLATLATEGALKQAERIMKHAAEERARLNQELSAISERLDGLTLSYAVKAGETGKLYGSITNAMIADSIEEETSTKVERRDIDSQPLKTLGVHNIPIRLTIDLVPEITVLVHREGESPESAYAVEEQEAVEVETAGQFVDLQEELAEEEAAAEETEALEQGVDLVTEAAEAAEIEPEDEA
jgi:large subunit ribosomal protein L9